VISVRVNAPGSAGSTVLTGSRDCVRRAANRVSRQRPGGQCRFSPLTGRTCHLAARDRAHDDRPAIPEVGLVPVHLALQSAHARIERGRQPRKIGRLPTLIREFPPRAGALCPGGISLRSEVRRKRAKTQRREGEHDDDEPGQQSVFLLRHTELRGWGVPHGAQPDGTFFDCTLTLPFHVPRALPLR
jgi:hypothetical protein